MELDIERVMRLAILGTVRGAADAVIGEHLDSGIQSEIKDAHRSVIKTTVLLVRKTILLTAQAQKTLQTAIAENLSAKLSPDKLI